VVALNARSLRVTRWLDNCEMQAYKLSKRLGVSGFGRME
jgi:hypothetical protein